MKKLKTIFLAVVFLGVTLSQTGCIGSFQLTSNLYNWNKNNVGGKWGSELVFLALTILPVYAVTLLADGIVLNSIEFWTGNNPLAMKTGEKEIKIVRNGEDVYRLTAKQNRVDVEKIDGSHTGVAGAFIYDADGGQWEFVSEGNSYALSGIE